MSSINLWFSSYDQWKETTNSSSEAEDQYLKIRPEVGLGSPTSSAVYSGCYFWDVTEVVNTELRKDKVVTFLIRNENTEFGYGVNIFSSKMHRLWPKRFNKSPRLVLEFADWPEEVRELEHPGFDFANIVLNRTNSLSFQL